MVDSDIENNIDFTIAESSNDNNSDDNREEVEESNDRKMLKQGVQI